MARIEAHQAKGVEKVNTEALLIASGQYVKRLLAFGPGRPRKTATVAALRPKSHPRTHPADIARSKHGVFQHADKFCEVRLFPIQHP